MNFHHQQRFFFVVSIVFGAVVISNAHAQTPAQQAGGVQICMDWHTVAEPTFGVAYRCTWNDIRTRQGNAPAVESALDMHLQNKGVGEFTLVSAPIDVPATGMIISFVRTIEMHPTAAERGTTLPNDPKDRCKNAPLGANRAICEQRVNILDAATGKPLAVAVDHYRFRITRKQPLNDVVDRKPVEIDLSPFAGKRIIIQTMALATYNGRGPAAATIASLSPIQPSPQTEDLK